jgi:hypothetical protein
MAPPPRTLHAQPNKENEGSSSTPVKGTEGRGEELDLERLAAARMKSPLMERLKLEVLAKKQRQLELARAREEEEDRACTFLPDTAPSRSSLKHAKLRSPTAQAGGAAGGAAAADGMVA